MKIAFDIDDVITETSKSLLKKAEEYGIDFNNPLTTKVKIMKGKFETEAAKIFAKKWGVEAAKKLELKEDADLVIRELKRKGLTIHLITARDEEVMPGITQATIDYMAEKDIPYDGLHIGVHNKRELCEKLGITCLTDDSIDTCRNLIGSKTTPILFTTEVNSEFDAGKIKRVVNWEEVTEAILNILSQLREDGEER